MIGASSWQKGEGGRVGGKSMEFHVSYSTKVTCDVKRGKQFSVVFRLDCCTNDDGIDPRWLY